MAAVITMANAYTGVESENTIDGIAAHVSRQRSTNTRLSLYPRPRTAAHSSEQSDSTSPTRTSQRPCEDLMRSSEDIPRHGAFNTLQRPSTAHNAAYHEPYRAFTAPVSQPGLPHRPSEASRLRQLNGSYRSPSSNGRYTPTSDQPVENFSRPRQPSLRRRNESPNPNPLLQSSIPLEVHEERSAPRSPVVFEFNTRDRGFSASSSQSIADSYSSGPGPLRPPDLYPSGPASLRPSASIPDYHAADSIYTRQRNLTNANYRPGRALSRPDSNYSAHRREPILRPNGYDEDEVRASFRSALTTNSSMVDTIGTERSSVMTRSSTTSIYGRDEGMSVDDAIGMYEGGFQDSGLEDNYDTRPDTADSQFRRRSKLAEAMNDTLSIPARLSIRDSTAFFKPGMIPTLSRSSDPPELDRSPSVDSRLDVPDPLQPPLSPRTPEITSRPGTRANPDPVMVQSADRDRYGFRKKTQYITIEQYEAWNGPYTEYLDRRKKKWIAMMKDGGLITSNPTQFPPKSTKVKRFVRKGIPPEWRGDAWFYYAGGPSMIAKNQGVYDDLVRRAAAGAVTETDDEIIERDLNRTFPDNVKFKPDADPASGGGLSNSTNIIEPETSKLQSLRRVLQAFSIYNPKIGYCQSLNFLAGLLLLFMDEERSFWMLNIITRVYLPGTHEVNLEGANVDLGVLMMSIKESMPPVWAKIGGELDGTAGPDKVSMRLPPITLCCTAWFMSCFIGTLPIESTLRVWDSFFYEGSKTLFRIALAIFKCGEVEIKAVSDPMEIFQVVQTIPRRLIDANGLMETCFRRRNGFGHLSQATIEQRRAERRKGYAEERAIASGDLPPPSKGKLFSKASRKKIRPE